jgi:hypothetical protein
MAEVLTKEEGMAACLVSGLLMGEGGREEEAKERHADS